MKRALLIEFDPYTGKRAGDISSRDPGLFCRGWQKLDSVPALEIRLIRDDRDVSQYTSIPGVTLLEGRLVINAAIDDLNLERYSIDNEVLFRMNVEQKGIDLSAYNGLNSNDVLKDLHSKKVLGLRKKSPEKV